MSGCTRSGVIPPESFYFNWADPERRSFTLARTMTGAHFEQSGRVTGWTHFGPELRGDVWIEETHVSYELQTRSSSGVRSGQGVVEHVWRATPEQIRARSARLAAIGPALRR